jgi:hypothetical protein
LKQLRTALNIVSSHPEMTLDEISRDLDQSVAEELRAQERKLEDVKINKLEAIRQSFTGKRAKNKHRRN